MGIGEILGIVLAIAGLATAYHIAARAGTFSKALLDVTIGSSSPRDEDEPPPEVFVYGVPVEPVERYLIEWPNHLRNAGNTPIRNLELQLAYDRSMSTLYPYPDGGEQHGVSRRVMPAEDFISVTYHVGDLQLDANAVLPDFVHFDPDRASQSEPTEYAMTRVGYTIRADNIREQTGKFWLVCIRCASFDELVSRFGSFIKPLFELAVQERVNEYHVAPEAEPATWRALLCQLSASARGDGVHRLAFDKSEIAQLVLVRRDAGA